VILGWLASLTVAHFGGITTVVSWVSIVVAFGGFGGDRDHFRVLSGMARGQT